MSISTSLWVEVMQTARRATQELFSPLAIAVRVIAGSARGRKESPAATPKATRRVPRRPAHVTAKRLKANQHRDHRAHVGKIVD